jgi:hypothetical protein
VTLGLVGFVTAFWLWRRLGDWRIATQTFRETVETSDVTNAAWAELVNTAGEMTAPNQQLSLVLQRANDSKQSQLRTFNLLLTSVTHQPTQRVVELEVADAVLKSVLARQAIQTAQESDMPSVADDRPTRHSQRQPAWALALRGQSQNAHGLA